MNTTGLIIVAMLDPWLKQRTSLWQRLVIRATIFLWSHDKGNSHHKYYCFNSQGGLATGNNEGYPVITLLNLDLIPSCYQIASDFSHQVIVAEDTTANWKLCVLVFKLLHLICSKPILNKFYFMTRYKIRPTPVRFISVR